MYPPSSARPDRGRAHLAVLAGAALVGAMAAGATYGVPASAAPDTAAAAIPLADVALAEAPPAAPTGGIVDETPRLATVDAQLIRSVARQVLLEQDRPEHLTDVDLIARDVLALHPADPAEADRLTRETLLGFGPGGPVVDGPDAEFVPAPPQCPPTARACIDVDGKRAWMLDAGRVTYGPVPITTGKPGYETARGTHGSCGTSATTTASRSTPPCPTRRTSPSAAWRSTRGGSTSPRTGASTSATTPPPTSSRTCGSGTRSSRSDPGIPTTRSGVPRPIGPGTPGRAGLTSRR